MAKKKSMQLAEELLHVNENITNKKIDKAQYDKSYNATILGINQDFTDDVTEEEQQALIKKYSIPEVPDKDNYYTFKINGNYYVKSSNTDFKLYENVKIRIPNGSWDNMYIEVQRDTINESGSEGKTENIKFTLNKLYYGDQVYNLQRGTGKKILAITQGNKCTTIYSNTRADSEVAALAAVMKGLDEPWTLEYDVYIPADEYYASPMSGCPFESGVEFEVDWGDGTETTKGISGAYSWNIEFHIYKTKGLYRLRIKTEATKIDFNHALFDASWNHNSEIIGRGNHVYIGGTIEEIKGYDQNVTRISWGENIKRIYEASQWGRGIGINVERSDISLPPFVESISDFNYLMTDFFFIPATCTSIIRSLNYCSTNELVFEDGDVDLSLEGYCFCYSAEEDTGTPYGAISHLEIPKRLKIAEDENNSYHHFNKIRLLTAYFTPGITTIPAGMLQAATSGHFNVGDMKISDYPKNYIYIPKTVTSIGNIPFYAPCVIVYQGNKSQWDSISKSLLVAGAEDSSYEPEELVCLSCNDSDFYSHYSTLLRVREEQIEGGTGISVSDNTISILPATDEHIGGVRVADYSGIKNLNGILELQPATTKRIGGLTYGDGLQREPQYEDGVEPDESTEPKNYSNALSLRVSDEFEFIEHPENMYPDRKTYQGRKLGLKIGNGLSRSEEESNYGAVQINAGAGISFDENGALVSEGSSYKAGEGIIFTENDIEGEPKEIINVNIDNDTIVLNDDGKLKANGVTIENAIVIQEDEAVAQVKEYHTVYYTMGNKIGCGGVSNIIPVQTYPVYNSDTIDYGTKTSMPSEYECRQSFTFNPPALYRISNTSYELTKITLVFKSASTTSNSYDIVGTTTDGEELIIKDGLLGYFNVVNSYVSLFMEWWTVRGAGFTAYEKTFPNGCVIVGFGAVCSNNIAEYPYNLYHAVIGNQNVLYIPFASEIEYKAAISLTETWTETFIDVEEIITEG